MAYSLFKVPVEPETTAVKIEKVLASTRSPIRRNRNTEVHSGVSQDARRTWRADALPLGDPNDYIMTPNQSHNTSNDNLSSSNWNSRLIRILEHDRDRLGLPENSELHRLRTQNSGTNSSSNPGTREYIGSDGTSNLITSFRQERTSRLRRMAGRHSLLATPNITDEFLLRIAPSTHTVERFLRVFDHTDEASRSALEASDVEIDEPLSSETHLTTSGIVQRLRAFYQSNQDQNQLETDQYSQNPFQTRSDQQSPQNGRLSARGNAVGENYINQSVSDGQAPVEDASSTDTSVPRDLSGVQYDSTILDKREDSQVNIDSSIEGGADSENLGRAQVQERTSSGFPRNFADFIASWDSYLFQTEGSRINTSNNLNQVTSSSTNLDSISDD
ncbi:hypothetical protein GcC1_163003 [Golovinomyces cichoracearum]|uniref:Uncharacterized protein n=1 Tax=Golovinomyces cichoracearum TaxID=62708 RepID=A0A420HTK5_9PEZI|nr:hypothetical protein GcC1_163003 [Golovinomyces cichoracearum]